MIIKLPDENNSIYKELYIGNRKRLATASGCCFISDNILAINHLIAQKIFIVRFDYPKNAYEIIDQIDTTFKNNRCITELIHVRNGLIVVSNFDDKSFSTYKIDNNCIYKLNDYYLTENAEFCHGIKYYTDNIVCFTTVQTVNLVCFYDLLNNHITFKFDHKIGRPKDICFLSDDKMIVIYTLNSPAKENYKLIDSVVHLVQIELGKQECKILSEFIIPDSQLDCCDCINDLVFITVVQDTGDSVVILKVNNDRLSYSNKISGFDVPHGLAIHNNLLAVTNYGDNTVKLIELN